MKKLIIIAHSSTLILLTALGGCENIQPPQCENVVEVTYIDGYVERNTYQCDCLYNVYQYKDETDLGPFSKYNTIRFRLISKTVLKK